MKLWKKQKKENDVNCAIKMEAKTYTIKEEDRIMENAKAWFSEVAC